VDVWVELADDAGRRLWAEFAQRFRFRAGVARTSWPAIDEPAPSVTWDLSRVFAGDCTGGFEAGMRRMAELVLCTLQDCTGCTESVVFHDWAHPSRLFHPHAVEAVDDVPGWDTGGLFPNGDYTIFVSRDHRLGIVGHPWEQSLCVFGDQALRAASTCAASTRDEGILGPIIRRDGQPA
jgi:hypothetical protein